MSVVLKIGDHVTVMGMIYRQLHRCIVTELSVTSFRAAEVDFSPRVGPREFARDHEEKDVNWALGWDTPDVQSLHALTVLENCSW